jgi:deazaflavin-dependent oxidoreductase (nitroreductase family)
MRAGGPTETPERQVDKIRRHRAIWRVINPPARALAGTAPWWVIVETTGRTSGQPRRTPLAAGPIDDEGMWLIAVHGRHADWVRNIEAEPRVRLRSRRVWYDGTATLHPFDQTRVARFNGYARGGPRTFGVDPLLVHISYR